MKALQNRINSDCVILGYARTRYTRHGTDSGASEVQPVTRSSNTTPVVQKNCCIRLASIIRGGLLTGSLPTVRSNSLPLRVFLEDDLRIREENWKELLQVMIDWGWVKNGSCASVVILILGKLLFESQLWRTSVFYSEINSSSTYRISVTKDYNSQHYFSVFQLWVCWPSS